MILLDAVSHSENLKPDACNGALEALSQIPEGLGRIELVASMEPICEILSELPELSAEVFFRQEIQPKFDFTATETSGYLREIVRRRRVREIDLEMEQIRYGADFDGLIDLVDCAGECAFLIREMDNVLVRKETRVDGVRLIPPPKQNIPWLLPNACEVLRHFESYRMDDAAMIDARLFDDLILYYKRASQLPIEEGYHMLAAHTLHTYLLESANYSPFICFHGAPAHGKSRTAKAMTYVSYRGVVLESFSVPRTIRMARDLKATLFFDVRDVMKKIKQQHAEDCILLRFEKGAVVVRVLRPGAGAHRDLELYSVFGPTIFATNESMDDPHNTRSLLIHMPSAAQSFEMDITPGLGLLLKERLVAFRAYHLGRTLPDCNKPARGRLGDLTKPLLQMIRLAKPVAEEMLLRFIQQQETERMLEKSESPQALLVQALSDAAHEASSGRLLIKTILHYLKRNNPTSFQRDSAWVGRSFRRWDSKKSGAARMDQQRSSVARRN